MYHRLASRLVRRAYDDLNRHDIPAVAGHFAEDAVFHFPGDHALSGTYRGREEIAAFFGRLWQLFPSLSFSVTDIAAKGPPWDMSLFVRYSDFARSKRL